MGIEQIKKMCDQDGKCGNCRDCCSSNTKITTREYKMLKKKLTKKILDGYILRIEEIGIKEASFCPFQNGEECLIYAFRPEICKLYTCDINRIDITKFTPGLLKEKPYSIIDILPNKFDNIKQRVKKIYGS